MSRLARENLRGVFCVITFTSLQMKGPCDCLLDQVKKNQSTHQAKRTCTCNDNGKMVTSRRAASATLLLLLLLSLSLPAPSNASDAAAGDTGNANAHNNNNNDASGEGAGAGAGARARGGGGWPVPTKKAERPKMKPKPQLPEITHRVYLNIEIEGEPHHSGQVVLGLFGGIAPKAVENFRSLCACDKGNGQLSDKPLCYKGTEFHRIIPNFLVQGGDITHGDGTGGESIYGGHFEDETFEVKHDKRLLLSMANHGKKHTNGSQFFINTVKTRWLDNKNVVFGTVLEGDVVIHSMEQLGTYSGKPTKKVTIVDSGEIQ